MPRVKKMDGDYVFFKVGRLLIEAVLWIQGR
jgi:hypothetical protein